VYHEKVGLIERWYLLNELNQFNNVDYTILELYLLENIQQVINFPSEIIHCLLQEEKLHSYTKLKIQEQTKLEHGNLTKPLTGLTIISKQTLRKPSSTLIQTDSCILNVKSEEITKIILTSSTPIPVQVYIQTHFKLVDGSGGEIKREGHYLQVIGTVELQLHAPCREGENFEFEFSGFVTN